MAGLPTAAVPSLERLLTARAPQIVRRTTNHMYAEHRPGWFGTAPGVQAVTTFLATVANCARSGEWPAALSATADLFARAASSSSATYQDAFLFLRTLGTALRDELRAEDPAAPAEIARLFDALEQEAARSTNRFFASDPSRPGAEVSAPAIRQPPIRSQAARAAEGACRRLATLPACEGVLVLAGAPTSDHLEVIAAAGVELRRERSVHLAGDELSQLLAASATRFLHITRPAELLPIAEPVGRCLPVIGSTEIADRLRVATIILVAAGVPVESRLLAPLADLNLRLAALLGGAPDADVDAELERLVSHLGG